MTSPQHALWIRRGSQWQLALPLTALRDRMRRYGYTVYDLGDDSHLDRIPPEDHTPYSETGWPGTTPYGWVTAVDIMPPPAGSGLPSLLDLGLQIERDWPGWLKYMNRPTNLANTSAVHVSRQPDPASRSSSDVGHIHLSCRSDVTQSTAGNTYDPVARLRGLDEEVDVNLTDQFEIPNYDGDPDLPSPERTSVGTALGVASQRSWQALQAARRTEAKVDQLLGRPTATVDVAALATALAPLLAAALNVDEQAVVDALVSPAGQAALEASAFAAAQRAERE